LCGLTFNSSFAHAATGAIFTTNVACAGTNINLFGDKADVYLDGGPHHVGSAGLADGSYWVKVTVPNGDLLGISTTSVVQVVDGSFAQCYQLANILVKASNGLPGYDDTTNHGGEYKVWVSPTSTFDNGTNKTDNFKVKADATPPPPNSLGVISGTKFNDLNGNGIQDDGDVGLNGVTIYLDNNGNGHLDNSVTQDVCDANATEPCTVTDSNGNYSFTNLVAGTYTVREVVPAGWTQTTVNPLDIPISGNGDFVTGVDFGNFENVSISGTKFNDLNGDGVKGGNEPGLQNWVIEINDGSGTTTTTTGLSGNYSFSNLGPGTYMVCEQLQAGWVQTLPGTPSAVGCYTIVVSSGTNVVQDFGNFKLITLTVKKHVINDNGGTLQAPAFTLHLATTTTTDFAGSEAGTQFTLGPSSYTATEDSPTALGYAQTNPDANCSGTTVSGIDLTCTITNDDIAPSLTLNKVVVNDNGGTAHENAWTLTAAGVTPLSGPGAPGNADVVSGSTFSAGTYTLSEAGPAGYHSTAGWVCTGVTNAGNQIILGVGQNAVCTIVNDDNPPTRTLGFWSTHTQLTNTQWALHVTPTTDDNLCFKTAISATPSTNLNQLMGGFFAGISKQSTGQPRLAIDQARMILLQQLLAAILNRDVLGTNDGGVIATAQSAYCGNITSLMGASTSALDAFNQSGDPTPLPSTLNPGSATSQTSQKQAFIRFWDTTTN